MYTIRKQFKFEGAHQLFKAYSECCTGAIHGHSYLVEVFFRSQNLDDTGMVIDFGKVSDLYKDYIDKKWDHTLVMPNMFPHDYLVILATYNRKFRTVPYNPTAENMARQMFEDFDKINTENNLNVLINKVRVHETTTGWAEYYE